MFSLHEPLILENFWVDKMSFLAQRVQGIKPSPTLTMLARAKELKKRGEPVLDFSVGEPDFDTPQNIKDAAVKAMREGFTKYTDPRGIPELREAIAQKLKKDNNVDAAAENIAVCNGAKHALFNIFQALCEKGDEVIIPAPYWVSFSEMVKLCEGAPKILPSKNLKFSADELREKVSPKTKLLILNYPNNPSGVVYTKNELKKIAEIALENNFFVISDEIYEKFIYANETYTSLASLGKEIANLTITVNGVSKTYAMTGWRIGYLCARKDIANAINAAQGNASGNPNSIAQKAALEAITGPQDSVKKMISEFTKRREIMLKGFSGIKGFECEKPDGAFYAFPKISGCFDSKIKNSSELASFFLEQLKIAAVPGFDFGKESYMRFSFATNTQTIIEGIERLKKHFD